MFLSSINSKQVSSGRKMLRQGIRVGEFKLDVRTVYDAHGLWRRLRKFRVALFELGKVM